MQIINDSKIKTTSGEIIQPNTDKTSEKFIFDFRGISSC